MRFGSLFRVAENDTRQPLDTLLKNIGVQHQRVAGNALSRDQKKQLWDLYESNYANDSEKEPLLALIHEELQHNYQDPRAQFHFFMHNSHMLLTAKFVEQADGSVYFWAFNSDIQFQPYNFGIFVLEKLLDMYRHKDIHGHVLKWKEYLLRYYKRYGFEPIKNPDGSLKIELENWVESYILSRPAQMPLKLVA